MARVGRLLPNTINSHKENSSLFGRNGLYCSSLGISLLKHLVRFKSSYSRHNFLDSLQRPGRVLLGELPGRDGRYSGGPQSFQAARPAQIQTRHEDRGCR